MPPKQAGSKRQQRSTGPPVDVLIKYSTQHLEDLMQHITKHKIDLSVHAFPPAHAPLPGTIEDWFETLCTNVISAWTGLFAHIPIPSFAAYVCNAMTRAIERLHFEPVSHANSRGMDHPFFSLWMLLLFRCRAHHITNVFLTALPSVNYSCWPTDAPPAGTVPIDSYSSDVVTRTKTASVVYSLPPAFTPHTVPPVPLLPSVYQLTKAFHTQPLAEPACSWLHHFVCLDGGNLLDKSTCLRLFDLNLSQKQRLNLFNNAIKHGTVDPRHMRHVIENLGIVDLVDIPDLVRRFSECYQPENTSMFTQLMSLFFATASAAKKEKYMAQTLDLVMRALMQNRASKTASALLNLAKVPISQYPELEYQLAIKSVGFIVYSNRTMELCQALTKGNVALVRAVVSMAVRREQYYEANELCKRYRITPPQQLVHALANNPDQRLPSSSVELAETQCGGDEKYVQLPADAQVLMVNSAASAAHFLKSAQDAIAAVDATELPVPERVGTCSSSGAVLMTGVVTPTPSGTGGGLTSAPLSTAASAVSTASAVSAVSAHGGAGAAATDEDPAPQMVTPDGLTLDPAALLQARFPLMIGLDTESAINFDGRPQHPLLLQISIHNTAFLVDLPEFAKPDAPGVADLNAAIGLLWSHPRVLKLGQAFAEDISGLAGLYRHITAFSVCAPLLCVGTVCKNALPELVAATGNGRSGRGGNPGTGNGNGNADGDVEADADANADADTGAGAGAGDDAGALVSPLPVGTPTSIGLGSPGSGVGSPGSGMGSPQITVATLPASARSTLLSLSGAALRDVPRSAVARFVSTRTSPAGLATAVQIAMGKQLFKGQQVSDWSRRPLSSAQLTYAALDAWVLPVVILDLARKIAETTGGGLAWLHLCANITDPVTAENSNSNAKNKGGDKRP